MAKFIRVTASELISFLVESNAIEGIEGLGNLTVADIKTIGLFIEAESFNLHDLNMLVTVLQPDAKLRNTVGMDVRVYNYKPPKGGAFIQQQLELILNDIQGLGPWGYTAFRCHQHYEALHPYTDGNGRSGRLLWLWQKLHREGLDTRTLAMPFLQHWYYESLKGTFNV